MCTRHHYPGAHSATQDRDRGGAEISGDRTTEDERRAAPAPGPSKQDFMRLALGLTGPTCIIEMAQMPMTLPGTGRRIPILGS